MAVHRSMPSAEYSPPITPDAGPVDIFVSYAREDEELVKRLCQALETQGWSVFWDRRIPAGSTWDDYIGRALAESRCVIVAWSETSVASEFVREEAERAKHRGVLVPVLLDPVEPPFGFSRIQAADLSGWAQSGEREALEQLFADIRWLLSRAQREAEARAKRQAEEQGQREAEARAKRQAEEQGQREAEARAKRPAEEQAQRAKADADARAKADAARAKADTDGRAKMESTEGAASPASINFLFRSPRSTLVIGIVVIVVIIAISATIYSVTGVARDTEAHFQKSCEKAASLFQKACDGGEMMGCTYLGEAYETGTGVTRDATRAVSLFQKACDGGEMMGCRSLAGAYEDGTGVPRDATQAAALYQKACDGGDKDACAHIK